MSMIKKVLPLMFCLIAIVAGNINGKNKQPNVILIYLDDLNSYQLGCYGGSVKTPNIDRLADRGVKFTSYYPSSPVCTPSRYSLLTGEYASRNKTIQKKHPLNTHAFIRWNTDIIEGDYTLPYILKQHGYKTGMVGKWHNWDYPELAHVAIRANPNEAVIENRIKDNYKKVVAHVKKTGGFDYADALYATNLLWLPITGKLMHHNQHWLTYHAIQFIEQNKDNPFFLYFSTTLPHGPNPINTLKSGEIEATPAGYQTAHKNIQPSFNDILKKTEAEGPFENENEKGKYASILWIDDAVGALLKKLDELNITEKTIILLASDHESEGKMVLNKGKVPFIAFWKKHWPEGKTEDALVSNIDIAPTVIEACNIIPPKKMILDGQSLFPLMNGKKKNWRESLYLEITYTRGVVTDEWKYIATRYPDSISDKVKKKPPHTFNQEGTIYSAGSVEKNLKVRFNADKYFPGYFDPDQLYNLANDPGEQKNLATDIQFQEKLNEMQHILKKYSQELPHEFGEFTENRKAK
jgi:arylsulfatase A-like enzyme